MRVLQRSGAALSSPGNTLNVVRDLGAHHVFHHTGQSSVFQEGVNLFDGDVVQLIVGAVVDELRNCMQLSHVLVTGCVLPLSAAQLIVLVVQGDIWRRYLRILA